MPKIAVATGGGLLTGYPPVVPGPNGITAESSVETIWVRKIGQNDDTPELRLSRFQTSPYVYGICVFHMHWVKSNSTICGPPTPIPITLQKISGPSGSEKIWFNCWVQDLNLRNSHQKKKKADRLPLFGSL